MTYQLKRAPRVRKNGPCPECRSERCRSVSSFACWVRAYRYALRDHQFARCGKHSRMLRAAEIPIVMGPQPRGYEVQYAPSWAVFQLEVLREGRRVSSRMVLAALKADPRYGPPPEALLARLDELRAFAVLRGWSCERGSWSR